MPSNNTSPKKVSEITVSDLTAYLRITITSQSETNYLNTTLDIAKSFICSYTGLKAEELDDYPELVIVVYVLCQDMYDTRALYVDKSNINKVVDSILNLHSRNLLPQKELESE
ncbi:MAG: phage gp6-like head-tail connector protein [Clostridiales bacterium]|nr:phage gp6-like head-tail connector protein [Clostridiales bacterium]